MGCVSSWGEEKFGLKNYKAKKRIVAFSFRLLLRKIHLPPGGRLSLEDTKQPQNKGGEEDGEGGEDRGKDEDLTRELCIALAAPSGRELSPQVTEGECVQRGE